MKLCSTISLAKNVHKCLLWKKEHTLVISCKWDFLLVKWPWTDTTLSQSIWLLICEMKETRLRILKGFPCIKSFIIQYVLKIYAEYYNTFFSGCGEKKMHNIHRHELMSIMPPSANGKKQTLVQKSYTMVS